MLYYLFQYLEAEYQVPGARLFEYISFRSAMAIILSLAISTIYGKRIISYLLAKQVGESVRDLGLRGQSEKAGTPTMGGLIIIFATLVPVLLFAKLENIYVILLIVTTLWMGAIGFVDDYIKTFKKDKEGLKGKFKVLGQVGLGIIVGGTLFFHPGVTVKEETNEPAPEKQELVDSFQNIREMGPEIKTTTTTIPFVKNNEFDYSSLISWIDPALKNYAWLIFIPIVIFIVTAVSNGANLTDGIDGLAAGSSAIIVLTLGIFAWVSGNIIFSDYLNIMYIPRSGEMTIFISAFAGALVGFLWYNTYPAQIFMGDTGSLTIGGIIAVLAVATRKELLIPVLCGIFLMENLSVVLQVAWFKITKRKYGEGRRIFLMSPLHHHYQKRGYHESKIVVRFWIIGIFLAIVTIITLKVR
ncbi:phospho-N-acetylmuramoyl-pentapeptide-transferase [Salegentibacter mishustinae]|jgi:phospho-N-acetylmuramoyl-pentapeptide-transferase|uniref:Phospho-N-acetylmuramoyl-pentapeptide-transferase n=1 Tax=Salegentibacter mishustinae TaxID=270918 RepID=A0A0Q9ZI50_9FLAO|nr:phospho-N-acetylmuramoyl-pentapeptide-transferase [Salegentibacter mishustinae]KRG28513.1 phospho-N-acetylmuramoyl-pentapeptide-transferase [Salegentibacter mishustinae]PNW22448.1 phospho-N-acetylmuramoyl-pentapeptide-transferase [Salegentibacter mishustinae]PZX67686.1 phospho-N-acetylmuramoyl-pentapeptide-transferase [Salegentibacter mishustinae]UBZ07538.1 phospho-N-acetylmuramoyl-pentapeptide-transferase [Salegentibacter mishustinae]GGW78047.1 phospho-N-acetylmuramoyl-pentapeptide-transfe